MTTEHDPNHFITEMPETDDAQLQYSKRIRNHLTNKLMVGKDAIDVSDNKGMRTLLTLLKDQDSQIIATKRIAAAEKTADGFADIATALDSYLKNKTENGGPKFKRHDGEEDTGEHEGAPNVASINIPKREFIEGQLDPSGADVDIEEIMRKGREAQRNQDD